MYKYILFLLFSYGSLYAQVASRAASMNKPISIDTIRFKYQGYLQKFIVPNKVTTLQVNAMGAKGGTGGNGQLGGAGANITSIIQVTPGQVLYVVVGGFAGQSSVAKYGFGGNGGTATSGSNNFGGAGGGLSGLFTSSTPSTNSAIVVAGGGGGGSGTSGSSGYTGGRAANTVAGIADNGAGSLNYLVNSRYQYGYGATFNAVGNGGYAYDNSPAQNGSAGNDINGGVGGIGTIWQGAGGGGAGYYGGGGGAGGGSANGGGGGGSTKSNSILTSFGLANSTGDGSVFITCFSNSGLVLNLDASNTTSYIGSGTTWNDLSGISPNVTLTSSTYNSSNGGSIAFNGTSSYADFTANLGNTNVVTVEMWVKTNSLKAPAGAMYFGFGLYDVWTKDGNIGFNTSGGDLYGIPSAQVDYLGIEGNWRHLVFVMNNGSKTNNKIYVNGESQVLSQLINSFGTANANFNSGNGRISSWRNDLGWLMNIQVANFKVYNRELTTQEIKNNFNVFRTKYYLDLDGLSPTTASSSAYQIKQDYPTSTDGFYWIKNANINGGDPFKIYADMTTEGGGWTLIMKNSSYAGWTYANSVSLNTSIPFKTNAEVISTSTSNYSIISWADFIKKSASGFQFMFDAGTRNSFGGVFTANAAYSFVSTSNAQTDITVDRKFGSWNFVSNNNGFAQRMPFRSTTAGGGVGYLTNSSGSGNWYATLISYNSTYSPAPWLNDPNGGTSVNINPGIIWYWVR